MLEDGKGFETADMDPDSGEMQIEGIVERQTRYEEEAEKGYFL